jgi:hypothetical protein
VSYQSIYGGTATRENINIWTIFPADASLKLVGSEPVRTGPGMFKDFWKFLNLELDSGSGSVNLTATEPDFWSGSVRFRFANGSEPDSGNTTSEHCP